MKKSIAVFGMLLLSISVFSQKQKTKQTTSAEIKIPLSPEHWDFQQGKVEFLDYKGVKAIKMDENSGNVIFKDLNFVNGTIEFDVEVNQAQPFPSLYFRWQSQSETELVYLRTGAANRKNDFDALQYASVIKGVNLWDLQHEYQSAANIKIGEWNHVRLVVSGKQLRVYVNNPPEADLAIPCLEGNTTEGKIALGTGFPGQVAFANLVVKPNEVEGLTSDAGPDLTKHDTRYIRNWQVSKPDSLPYGREVNAFMLPKADMSWESINAERRGLVNITRRFGGAGYRRAVWLKATIQAEHDQVQQLKMGFSDEIWVFINQKPVYVDKNIYIQNMRKSPNGRISLDNCSFQLPLVKGENQLLIAVSNDFYGWGIMARVENLDGISF